MTIRRLLLLPCLVSGHLALAQVTKGQLERGAQTRLEWSGTELYVTADSAIGVGVWVFGQGREAPHPAALRLQPDAVRRWLQSARRLLERGGRVADEQARPGHDRSAPLLRDALGGGVLLELRDTSTALVVTFAGRIPGRRFVARVDTGSARDLLDALARSARAGRYDSARAEAEQRDCPRPGGAGADSLVEAWPVRVPAITYPAALGNRGEGHVVIEYAVDTAGVVDTTSLRVRYATAPAFGAAAIAALRGALFEPARVRGRPVRSCADAVVRFRPPA